MRQILVILNKFNNSKSPCDIKGGTNNKNEEKYENRVNSNIERRPIVQYHSMSLNNTHHNTNNNRNNTSTNNDNSANNGIITPPESSESTANMRKQTDKDINIWKFVHPAPYSIHYFELWGQNRLDYDKKNEEDISRFIPSEAFLSSSTEIDPTTMKQILVLQQQPILRTLHLPSLRRHICLHLIPPTLE